MALRDPTIAHVRSAKQRLESDLMDAIGRAVDGFTAETGLGVSGVSVHVLCLQRHGCMAEFRVTGVRCNVEMEV